MPQPDARYALVLATLIAVATAVMGCGPATPSRSPSFPGSSTREPASSPSALATHGSESPTPSPSPALAVVQATTLATILPTGLSRSVAIVVGNRIDIYGGFASTGSTTGEILELDPATDRVAAIGQLAVPVHDAAGVALGGVAVIFGGGSGAPTSVVQEIDSDGTARVIGNLPTARADLSAVAIGNSAIVVGGAASGVLPPELLATEDGIHFRVIATLAVAVRYAAVAQAGGLIYVIGGAGADGERADIQRIDLATGKAEVIGEMAHAISHASAVVIGGRMFILGGRSAGAAQDAIWQLDPVTGATQLVGRLPQPVSDFPVAVLGGVGYAVGGETDRPITTIVAIVVS